MTPEAKEILLHILQARTDNASSSEAYIAWGCAKDVVEYALAGNIECLRQFDYLLTNAEKEEQNLPKCSIKEN